MIDETPYSTNLLKQRRILALIYKTTVIENKKSINHNEICDFLKRFGYTPHDIKSTLDIMWTLGHIDRKYSHVTIEGKMYAMPEFTISDDVKFLVRDSYNKVLAINEPEIIPIEEMTDEELIKENESLREQVNILTTKLKAAHDAIGYMHGEMAKKEMDDFLSDPKYDENVNKLVREFSKKSCEMYTPIKDGTKCLGFFSRMNEIWHKCPDCPMWCNRNVR